MAARSLRRCPPGARVHASAVVDGERLESTTFDVPAAGGVRTILVAGLGLGTGGGAPAPAPRPPSAAVGTGGAVVRQQHPVCDRVPGRHHRGVLPARDRQQLGRAGHAGLATGHHVARRGRRRLAARGRVAAGRRERAARVDRRAASGGRDRRARSPSAWNRGARVTSSRRPSRWRSIRSPLGVQRLSGLTVESPQASNVREASLSGQAFFIASGPSLPAGHAAAIDAGGTAAQEPSAALHRRSRWPRWWPASARGWR